MAPVGVVILVSGLVGILPVASAVNVAAVSAPGVPTRVVTTGATPRTINVAWTAPISNGGAAITLFRRISQGRRVDVDELSRWRISDNVSNH